MTQKHSPTPWGYDEDPEQDTFIVYGKSLEDLSEFCFVPKEADASFIVKACNSYDEMLAFIEKVAAWDFDSDEAFELLKKVRG